MCVPFYVLHKIFAGLLDQYARAANQQALEMASALGDWVGESIEGAIARGGLRKWQGVLNTEWGECCPLCVELVLCDRCLMHRWGLIVVQAG